MLCFPLGGLKVLFTGGALKDVDINFLSSVSRCCSTGENFLERHFPIKDKVVFNPDKDDPRKMFDRHFSIVTSYLLKAWQGSCKFFVASVSLLHFPCFVIHRGQRLLKFICGYIVKIDSKCTQVMFHYRLLEFLHFAPGFECRSSG